MGVLTAILLYRHIYIYVQLKANESIECVCGDMCDGIPLSSYQHCPGILKIDYIVTYDLFKY